MIPSSDRSNVFKKKKTVAVKHDFSIDEAEHDVKHEKQKKNTLQLNIRSHTKLCKAFKFCLPRFVSSQLPARSSLKFKVQNECE